MIYLAVWAQGVLKCYVVCLVLQLLFFTEFSLDDVSKLIDTDLPHFFLLLHNIYGILWVCHKQLKHLHIFLSFFDTTTFFLTIRLLCKMLGVFRID